MRFVAAIVGMLVSVPPLIFFWIGAQTFIRQKERALAVAVAVETGALLLLSIALLFTASVQLLQFLLLLATLATIVGLLIAYRLFK